MLEHGQLVPVLGLFRMTRMGEGGCGPSPGKLCLTRVWIGSVIKNVHTIKNVPERHSLQKAKPRKAEQGSEGSSPYGTRNIYSGNIPCRQHTGLQSSSSPMTETCPYWSASSALWPGIRTCHLTHRWIVLFCSSQVLFVYFLTPKQIFFSSLTPVRKSCSLSQCWRIPWCCLFCWINWISWFLRGWSLENIKGRLTPQNQAGVSILWDIFPVDCTGCLFGAVYLASIYIGGSCFHNLTSLTFKSW